jgi:hypothetical protein
MRLSLLARRQKSIAAWAAWCQSSALPAREGAQRIAFPAVPLPAAAHYSIGSMSYTGASRRPGSPGTNDRLPSCMSVLPMSWPKCQRPVIASPVSLAMSPRSRSRSAPSLHGRPPRPEPGVVDCGPRALCRAPVRAVAVEALDFQEGASMPSEPAGQPGRRPEPPEPPVQEGDGGGQGTHALARAQERVERFGEPT